MATQVEVVYPSTSSFSGTSQLNLGPYAVPTVATLLRCEARGMVNFQGATISATSIEANTPLWAVQWVNHGSSPADCITTADGPNWLIREQLGHSETRVAWSPSSNTAAYLAGYGFKADWAGQLIIGAPIDLYFSMRAPTGASIPTMNLFGSIRFWWN